MKLIKQLLYHTRCGYLKIKSKVYEALDSWEVTSEQAKSLSLKLDVLATAAAVNATAWGNNVIFQKAFFVLITLFVCAILWTTSFILKGYKDA